MADKFRTGPAFQVHVPMHPGGTDPSHNIKAIGQPLPIRESKEFQWITRGNGSGLVGRMDNDGLTVLQATADITVVQANCTPGFHLIRVGEAELRPGVDFLVGANDIALAANLAGAITALPGYTGTSDGVDTVTVTTNSGHGDDHRIEVVEWGAASAFTLGALNNAGFMDRGDPHPDEPVFT